MCPAFGPHKARDRERGGLLEVEKKGNLDSHRKSLLWACVLSAGTTRSGSCQRPRLDQSPILSGTINFIVANLHGLVVLPRSMLNTRNVTRASNRNRILLKSYSESTSEQFLVDFE